MLSAGTLWAEINPKPFIVPELKEWKGAEGMTQLSGNIVVKSSKLNAVAQALAADYKEMFGKELIIKKESKSRRHRIDSGQQGTGSRRLQA